MEKPTNSLIYFKSILNKKNNYKKDNRPFLKNLSKYFKLKKYKIFTSGLKKKKNYQADILH